MRKVETEETVDVVTEPGAVLIIVVNGPDAVLVI